MVKINLNIHSDSRGRLGVTEFRELPFQPKRFFWIFDTPADTARAGHGHRTCHQFIFVQQGTVSIRVTQQSGDCLISNLEVGEAFHLQPFNWLELLEFSQGAVLGVFASEEYSREEYLESLESFLGQSK